MLVIAGRTCSDYCTLCWGGDRSQYHTTSAAWQAAGRNLPSSRNLVAALLVPRNPYSSSTNRVPQTGPEKRRKRANNNKNKKFLFCILGPSEQGKTREIVLNVEGLEPPQTRGGDSALERGRGDDFRSLSPRRAAGYQ